MSDKKIYCMPWDGMLFSIKEEDIPHFDVSKTYHKGDLIKVDGEVKVIMDFVEANPYETVMEPVSHFECVTEFNPKTVQIGNKLWMTENLAYDDKGYGITYNLDNKEYYYTWNAAKRVAKKLGWKLPSDEDWNKAFEECKEIKNKYYDYDKCSLKEKLGIKLVGHYYNNLNYIYYNGYFWSSSERHRSYAWIRRFDSSSAIRNYYYYKDFRLSVRLVKDV